MHAHIHTYTHTNIHIHIHMHMHMHMHIHIHIYIHTYLHTYIPTYLHTYIPTYLHTYIPTYLHTYSTSIPPYLHTSIPTYLHTYIPTYLHTYIPTYLHTCKAVATCQTAAKLLHTSCSAITTPGVICICLRVRICTPTYIVHRVVPDIFAHRSHIDSYIPLHPDKFRRSRVTFWTFCMHRVLTWSVAYRSLPREHTRVKT